MAREPQIQIEIRPDGTVRFEIDGVVGEDCEALEKLMLEAVGGEVVDRQCAPAFFQRQSAVTEEAARTKLRRG